MRAMHAPLPRWAQARGVHEVVRTALSAPPLAQYWIGADSPEEPLALVRDRKGAVCTPKAIDFVDALPVTGSGKLDKKAIRAKFCQGQGRSVH